MSKPVLLAGLAFGAALASAEHEAAGGHADNTIYWKWANFAILAGLLGYAIARSGPAFFRSRTEEIHKDLKEAAVRKAAAESRAEEIDRRIAALGGEVERIRAGARQEMTAEAERAREETARLVTRIHAGAEQEIGSLIKHAGRELRAHSANLAVGLAEQKVRARLGPAEDAALVSAFAAELGRSPARIG